VSLIGPGSRKWFAAEPHEGQQFGWAVLRACRRMLRTVVGEAAGTTTVAGKMIAGKGTMNVAAVTGMRLTGTGVSGQGRIVETVEDGEVVVVETMVAGEDKRVQTMIKMMLQRPRRLATPRQSKPSCNLHPRQGHLMRDLRSQRSQCPNSQLCLVQLVRPKRSWQLLIRSHQPRRSLLLRLPRACHTAWSRRVL